jgi:tripartite-type tricarboxylate transporter receptor subunit TctC
MFGSKGGPQAFFFYEILGGRRVSGIDTEELTMSIAAAAPVSGLVEFPMAIVVDSRVPAKHVAQYLRQASMAHRERRAGSQTMTPITGLLL